ncbi:MAG: PrsW family intramembrane metalloprotease [Candidatus Thalassarchaeaceae archaeon]
MTRIIVDASGKRYLLEDPAPLSVAPSNIRLATKSKPWNNYWRMLGTVILAFILIWFGLTVIIAGLIYNESILTAFGAVCSLLPLPVLIWLHKPKLMHVRLAIPHADGKTHHPLTEGGSLKTPEKTKFQRFIIPDDSVLDLPPLRQVWGIFIVIIVVGSALSIPLILSLLSGDEDIFSIVFIVSFLPVMLLSIAAFSIPVFAWWATSSKIIGLPTRRRDAEAWMIAGMASALPALIVNSFIFPSLLPGGLSQSTEFALTATISAPIGEEIFKFLAICLFLPSIRNARKGFQIGFTVGLGFALIENLTYIIGSGMGGALTLTLTTLMRGIGSIPGHGLWTGISGFGLGYFAQTTEANKRMKWILNRLSIKSVDLVENFGIDVDGDGDYSGYDNFRPTFEEIMGENENQNVWGLIDSKTGETIDTMGLQTSEISNALVTSTQASEYKKNVGFRILPPSNVFSCLILAILGHAFWNGTSVGVDLLGRIIGLGSGGVIVLSLAWVAVLITGLLIIARAVFKGIRSLPHD